MWPWSWAGYFTSVRLLVICNVGIDTLSHSVVVKIKCAYICKALHALPGMKYMLCKWRQVELFSCLPDSLCLQNWAVPGLAPGQRTWTNERFPFSFSHACRASLPATVLHLHQWARVLILPASPADAAGPVCVHLWDWLLPRPPLLCR